MSTATFQQVDQYFGSGGGGGATAKFPVIGSSAEGEVADVTLAQATEYGTRKPLYWPSGDPKMQAVITLRDFDPVADEVSDVRLFVKGTMKAAIDQAVKAAGADGLRPGGYLKVTYVGNGQPRQPHLPAPKTYAAEYKAPGPESGPPF